jgi:hypothetical protein
MIQYRAEREETNIIISKVQSLQEKDQQWLAACRTKIDLSRKKNSNEDSNFRVDTAQGEAQPTKIFNKSVRKILDLAKQQNFAPSRRGKKSSVSAKETRINAARPPQESQETSSSTTQIRREMLQTEPGSLDPKGPPSCADRAASRRRPDLPPNLLERRKKKCAP